MIGHTSLSAAAAAARTPLPMPLSYTAGTAGRAIGDGARTRAVRCGQKHFFSNFFLQDKECSAKT